MAGKYFGIPFALSGDRAAIPDAAQPDGSVSFTQGFTLDYELENTDPNYKPVPREETNALYYDITEAIGIVQKQGFADWTIAAAPYPINAFVRHNDIVWRNAVAGNSAEPGTDATWADETTSFVDTINAPIATIAAAGTIDLTAGAPNTSQLVIIGTGVNINGFTVAANRFFVVKMTGASNTLVNSASINTGLGTDLTLAPGESFILRSTAANVVEVLCYSGGAKEVGEITFHAEGTVPPFKLKANGAAVSRTTYARLFAKIGTTYGAGDGSTTFNLPDTRGEGVRFWDDGRGIDTGRVLGSWQKGTLIVGDPDTTAPLTASPIGTGASQTAAQLLAAVGADAINIGDYANAQTSTSPTQTLTALGAGGLMNGSTRMRNIAFMGCIGY